MEIKKLVGSGTDPSMNFGLDDSSDESSGEEVKSRLYKLIDRGILITDTDMNDSRVCFLWNMEMASEDVIEEFVEDLEERDLSFDWGRVCESSLFSGTEWFWKTRAISRLLTGRKLYSFDVDFRGTKFDYSSLLDKIIESARNCGTDACMGPSKFVANTK